MQELNAVQRIYVTNTFAQSLSKGRVLSLSFVLSGFSPHGVKNSLEKNGTEAVGVRRGRRTGGLRLGCGKRAYRRPFDRDHDRDRASDGLDRHDEVAAEEERRYLPGAGVEESRALSSRHR